MHFPQSNICVLPVASPRGVVRPTHVRNLDTEHAPLTLAAGETGECVHFDYDTIPGELNNKGTFHSLVSAQSSSLTTLARQARCLCPSVYSVKTRYRQTSTFRLEARTSTVAIHAELCLLLSKSRTTNSLVFTLTFAFVAARRGPSFYL